MITIEEALRIALEAHEGQKDLDGNPVILHPMTVALAGRNRQEQIAGLLHDVVEDTEFTLEDVRNIYVDCGFESFFDIYINNALQCITHDKSIEYEPYIEICLKNPISALVKMLDLQDNLRIIDLVELNHENYDRSMRYVTYLYWINSKYHFLENIQKYREDLATPKEEEN